jgi:hypothetical protein
MLASLEGLDHVVVMVQDLDRAAGNWRALGFTLSPRGTHSAQMGSGNYTIMLLSDYLELLGILQDTPRNAASREFLSRRGEGVERAAFTTSNAIEGIEALRAQGIQATGPVEFSRPVDRPDGSKTEAAFSVFNWPVEERPGDLRLFACQHHTRNAVWIPALQSHSNTAQRILRLEVLARDPGQAARQMARLIGSEASPGEGGAVRVATAPGRGEFLFLSAESFRARHASVDCGHLPEEGVAALVLGVADLDAASRAIGQGVVQKGVVQDREGLVVPADRANGVMLVFEQS